MIALGDTADGGLRVPVRLPYKPDTEEYTYTWCHGATGTQQMFAALTSAGVETVAGRSCEDWTLACLHSIAASGLPDRLWPGFWDNDGRCCGTAGVANAFLTHYQRDTGGRGDEHLAFAQRLADALVERAVERPDDPGHVYWQFVEHRRDPPLLPPAASWMQGSAGISAYLFRHARVLAEGPRAHVLTLPDDVSATLVSP